MLEIENLETNFNTYDGVIKALNGVNLTKLQSYPEKNSFDSFFFLCDLDGHIEDEKVQKSLEELGLHCQDFHVLGVFEADPVREKKS